MIEIMELEQKDIKNRHQKYSSYECYIEKNPNRTWRGLKNTSNEKNTLGKNNSR